MQGERLLGARVGEAQAAVVQAETGVAHGVEHIRGEAMGKKVQEHPFIGVVKFITEDGMAAVSEMHADLVGAAAGRLD